MTPSFLIHLAVVFWVSKAISIICIGNCSAMETVEEGMQGHIVNGSNTTIDRFPHCVFLHVGQSYCGATVVSQRVVITAAHCVDHVNKTATDEWPNIDAFTGLSYKEEFKANAVSRVEKCHINENWTYKGVGDLEGDIALVFLKNNLPLNKHIKRVLISPVYPSHVKTGYVAGWGRTTAVTSRQKSHSHGLKVTRQTIRSAAECQRLIREYEDVRILHGVLCAGNENDPGLPSKGDSGSGLITANHQALGVVSFSGITTDQVVYYTNVSYYFTWIRKSIVQYFCKHIS